ncbi:MAG: aspartate aminotransferase family protein [Planctomycetes bacterium]|nr:aspartate aminotransferase family protein [Planctomycetota bacterium]
MGGKAYSLEPLPISPVQTKYRKMGDRFPVPESIPLLEQLRVYEPVSMSGQPPVVWAKAKGFQVSDHWGNTWLDWSSGVLVASAGHGRPEILKAIKAQAEKEMIHNYCFPSQIRTELSRKLVDLAPPEMDKAFILTTGSETTENAIKLSKAHGHKVGGPDKDVFITFDGAFHGRTLGSQLAGGSPALKAWIGKLDPSFVQVPFPGDFRVKDKSFGFFEKALADKGIKPENVCGVMTETYQGGIAAFLPVDYAQALRKWCDKYDILLIMDEVQAGFGRTGRMFGFEHYGIVPDLACFGKGISSSLPISAVIGRSKFMDAFEPGSMTSTHTGNPVCCAAAMASLDIVVKEDLPGQAATKGEILMNALSRIADAHPDNVLALNGKGMVAAVQVGSGGRLDGNLAWEIVRNCIVRGLLMFSPVGPEGASVKISPPIITPEDALEEGLQVLDEAFATALDS